MASPVRQILMVKFKDSTTPAHQDSLVAKYAALTNTISALKGFEWGTNLSEENVQPGYTHVFVTTFESPEARQEYFLHPDHQAYAAELRAAIENAIMFPFFTSVTLKAAF